MHQRINKLIVSLVHHAFIVSLYFQMFDNNNGGGGQTIHLAEM